MVNVALYGLQWFHRYALLDMRAYDYIDIIAQIQERIRISN